MLEMCGTRQQTVPAVSTIRPGSRHKERRLPICMTLGERKCCDRREGTGYRASDANRLCDIASESKHLDWGCERHLCGFPLLGVIAWGKRRDRRLRRHIEPGKSLRIRGFNRGLFRSANCIS